MDESWGYELMKRVAKLRFSPQDVTVGNSEINKSKRHGCRRDGQKPKAKPLVVTGRIPHLFSRTSRNHRIYELFIYQYGYIKISKSLTISR